MIRRLLPYPVLAVSLAVMWLLLSGITPGQIVIAVGVAVGATHALGALGETSPKIKSWTPIPRLFAIVVYDILRSNISVARILLSGTDGQRRSGFVRVPCRLESPAALAVLAIIITSTPGTAWLDYNSARRELLLHVFDLVDEDHWIELIGKRYEQLLLEIFG